jgi:hypothetical protein
MEYLYLRGIVPKLANFGKTNRRMVKNDRIGRLLASRVLLGVFEHPHVDEGDERAEIDHVAMTCR